MGYVDVAHVSVVLPDGRSLLDDVNFRVGEGATVALVGANGAGKSTLLRIIAGDQVPAAGSVARAGGLGVMRQFIGSVTDGTTVRELLLGLAPEPLRVAGERLERAEWAVAERDDEASQLRYAHALTAWGDAGGYDAEVLWDTVTVAALGLPLDAVQHRMVHTLSGGEQKRLALEALLRGPDEVLLLDEPDNFLDVPGKRWLEEQLRATAKTVLYVSHDREVLARTADRVVTVEARTAWTHGGGFGSYHEARAARLERLDELHRRWDEEHQRLRELVITLREQAKRSDAMAPKYRAMVTRLERFEAAGPPPERPKEQNVTMRLRGGRTGVRVLQAAGLTLAGADGVALTKPFDLDLFYGERVAVLGPNGTGKSHFLRLLAAEPIIHSGQWKIGARVLPGMFAQLHQHPELAGRTLVEILGRGEGRRNGVDRGRAIAALRRYELHQQADQSFDTLSGGQQARLQILLLELSGATMLLLDEPTDNLDVVSADALEEGLAGYDGTVLAVTHDRWFARSFDRYIVFGADGTVTETPEPTWAGDPGPRPAAVRARSGPPVRSAHP
ncbi:MAG TPA: ATP-binding cassette domain-containing protein [Mycobacteriales bacterium]|nr:ATP-binding cassette domain-containing protein [Mycobacteriales bacterium]